MSNNIINSSHKYFQFFVFFTLLVVSGAFSHLLSSEYLLDGGRSQISLLAKLLLVFSYVAALSLFVVHWGEFKNKVTVTVWLWLALMFWATISVFIGQFNIYTLMRLAGLLGCTLIGLMLYVSTVNLTQAVKILFCVCIAITLLNLVYINGDALLGFSAKNINGVFVQKNLLGHFSLLALFITSFAFVRLSGGYRLLSLVGFGAAAWLLFLSTSMTSNLLIPIAITAILASLVVGRYKYGRYAVLIIILLLAIGLIVNWTEILSLLGKNSTFTGRTSIWSEYGALIIQRPFIGHGYGAYPEVNTALIKLGPHSGYIEQLYYTGVIGSVIMIALVVQMIKHWWQIVQDYSLAFEACFLLGFMAVFLALNLTETYFLNRSGLFWPLFIYCSLQLSWLSKKVQGALPE